MSLGLVTQIIQLIIAPVVMVSACGIVLNGLLARYAAVNDRLRLMAHERWDLLRSASRSGPGDPSEIDPSEIDPFVIERLQELDIQIPQLLQRHHRLRDAVLLLYIAMLLFIACMVAIGAAAIAGFESLGALAL